jgi:ATP-binding cassette subfamily B protein
MSTSIDAHMLAVPIRPPSGPLSYVWYVACGRYRGWLALLVVGEALNATCGILLPYALSRILTGVSHGSADPPAALAALWPPLLLFVALCAGELIFGRINSAIQLRVTPRQRQYIARSLFDYLHRHSHRFLTENFAGALANRINEFSHGVNMVMWALITEFWPIAIVIAIANVLLILANAWLGGFALVWSVVFLALSLVLSRRTQPLASAASTARSRTVGSVVDSVANHATVRLFASLEHERRRLNETYTKELATVLRANRAMEQVRLFQFSASAVLKAGTVVMSILLWSRGAIDVGQFVMAVSLTLLIIAEVRNLSRRFLEFFESLGNVGSGLQAIFRPHELTDAPHAQALAITQGALEFSGVSFGYAPAIPIFRQLSVSIPAGQRIGLVGVSGSGKSTFVSLLLRLYDPQGGSIRVDGHDLRDLTLDALRRQIGLIPQDPTLFHRSLRENIRYGRPEASDAEVEAAASLAHASEFIAEIPGGYDALVGERGVKLSGGQRQRIAIARVLLKDAPVLILDEATASLDSLTEHAIQQALDTAMARKTVIIIAHRLSTIAHLDRILVFDHGEIVEDGTHAGLLERNGRYAALWNRQSHGLLPDSDPRKGDAIPISDPAISSV